ncbi:MAG: 4Fe-4S binding protein, partial [Finegoldia magna]|nr:4Fe-4S binding protein [Finegoldia magna]
MDKIKDLLSFGMKKNRYKIMDNFRHAFQSLWFLITNSYVEGFKTGKIYGGNLKKICVPGMNCYSCPGAKGSCPIGSLQAVIGNSNFKFSYYILGFLFFIGALMGRFVCGWLCPFGLIQDLLYKIPFFKKIKTFKYDKH